MRLTHAVVLLRRVDWQVDWFKQIAHHYDEHTANDETIAQQGQHAGVDKDEDEEGCGQQKKDVIGQWIDPS